jgi:hypothetical protein
MALCTGAMSAIRKLWFAISPALESIIANITKYTGLIKALETNLTVIAIVAIVPRGSEIEATLNRALDTITGVVNVVDSFAVKLNKWLAGKTQINVNSDLFKLASTASKLDHVASGATALPENFYDSAVQLHIIVGKGMA